MEVELLGMWGVLMWNDFFFSFLIVLCMVVKLFSIYCVYMLIFMIGCVFFGWLKMDFGKNNRLVINFFLFILLYVFILYFVVMMLLYFEVYFMVFFLLYFVCCIFLGKI